MTTLLYRTRNIRRAHCWFGVVFEPRDLWIGVYWTKVAGLRKIYVCIVPMLPILITWWIAPEDFDSEVS